MLALNPNQEVTQYDCRAWNFQNGLPITSVRAVTQTRDGYLWLGSQKGLVRFDGVSFTLVGVPLISELRNSSVQALYPSRAGGLWFGLEKSAYGYCSPGGDWRVGKDPQTGWDWDAPCLLESSQGTLWVGGERSAHGSPDTLALQRLFPNDSTIHVRSVFEDSKGRIWLGTVSRGLFYWQDSELNKCPEPSLDARIIHAITEDRSGRIWLGTHVGLVCLDTNLQPQAVAYPDFEINCLLVDRHGVLWAGTGGHGLVRCKDGVFSNLTSTNGLTSNQILALAEDREGSLWIGTAQGLNQLTDVKFQTLAAKAGISLESALSVTPSPRGGLWIGTGSGAVYWRGDLVAAYSTNTGLADPYVKRVLESRKDNDVFLIYGYCVVEVMHDGKSVARHTTPNMPVAMTEDDTGVIVSVEGDLYRVSRERLEPYVFKGGRKPDLYWILNLATGRDGSIWAASVNGVCRIKDGEFRQWTKQEGLMDYNARWVCEDDDGTIWIGMATGIACLRNGRVWNVRLEDGLLNANIWSVVPDHRGNLWVDTKIGLCRLNKKNLDDFFAGKISRIECTAYDGPEAVKPADKDRQENSACRTSEGRIWFPNPKGLLMVDPDRIPANTIPPPVHIQRVFSDGRELSRTNQITVPPGKGEVEFAYTALSYIAPQKVRFRYRLEGFDRNWVEAGDRRLAFYTNLKPRQYRFQVIAANADGVWNEHGDTVEILLLPRFSQTLWFKLLAGAAFLAVLAGLYALRMSRLRAKQMALYRGRELLETTVRERTSSLQAEVAQRIQAQSAIEIQKQQLEDEIEERKRAQLEVERVHRELVDTSRKIGQAEVASSVLHNVGNVLNSVNVSTEMLADRLRAMQLNILPKVAGLIKDHAHDLEHFFTTHEKGRRLPQYLEDFSQHLSDERAELLKEIKELSDNVTHIKEIVAMQQSYAKAGGLQETVPANELVESSLRIDAAGFESAGVRVIRQYQAVPPLTVDRHKALQILINVLRNARRACEDGAPPDKRVTVSIRACAEQRVSIAIEDNGIGIPPGNLSRIFSHGFTTRRNGHGFGLHSSALAAKEMGGALTVVSDGPGKGARFTLELPVTPASTSE